MALPVGFERKDDKKFEEITIPATATSVGDIGRRLMPIAELDIVGQTAFQVQHLTVCYLNRTLVKSFLSFLFSKFQSPCEPSK